MWSTEVGSAIARDPCKDSHLRMADRTASANISFTESAAHYVLENVEIRSYIEYK